jgi:endonuclease YncB( thermonuclease family)
MLKGAAVLAAAVALAAMPAGLAAEEPAVEFVAPADRDVTPPGMTPGPRVDGPLVRQPVPPPPPEPPRWRRFFLPVTIDAATFAVDGRTIAISGVSPPAVGARCPLADGGAWPCGRTALHALRMFLRGRAVECFVPYVEGAVDVVAPCRVGATDLGLWLLEAGWAQPDELATDDYRAAAGAARCAGRGMWRGRAPEAACPARSSG